MLQYAILPLETDMPTLDLHYVDELIKARRDLHGNKPGAPLITEGHRVGQSINRSCIVMLSALLQSYLEDVFKQCARSVFPALVSDEKAFDLYWKQMRGWGNPDERNIKSLFMRLGVIDIFGDLSWQGTTNARIKANLNDLNQIRNKIAHGTKDLTLGGKSYSLSLKNVESFRDFIQNFALRFSDHALRIASPKTK